MYINQFKVLTYCSCKSSACAHQEYQSFPSMLLKLFILFNCSVWAKLTYFYFCFINFPFWILIEMKLQSDIWKLLYYSRFFFILCHAIQILLPQLFWPDRNLSSGLFIFPMFTLLLLFFPPHHLSFSGVSGYDFSRWQMYFVCKAGYLHNQKSTINMFASPAPKYRKSTPAGLVPNKKKYQWKREFLVQKVKSPVQWKSILRHTQVKM